MAKAKEEPTSDKELTELTDYLEKTRLTATELMMLDEDHIDYFESEILCDVNGDFILIPAHTRTDKWLSGTKVKVRVERIKL